MITVKHLNVSTACYRDVALAIHHILDEHYEIAPWTVEQTFADLLRDETSYDLALADNQQIVGFLATAAVMGEIEITNLAVAKDYQAQGIASALLAQVSKRDEPIYLEVRANNQKALHLYQKFGFEAYHRRKAYYHNPTEDAILMKREP